MTSQKLPEICSRTHKDQRAMRKPLCEGDVLGKERPYKNTDEAEVS